MKVEMLDYIHDAYTTDKKYVVLKGARASGKSVGVAKIVLLKTFEKGNNVLCVRKTKESSKSQYDNILQALTELYDGRVARNTKMGGKTIGDFKYTKSPMIITNIKTGNEIRFEGLDSPLKLTSISATNGEFRTLWVEEAYQISRKDFETVTGSIGRGQGASKVQYILTFNPWNKNCWLYEDFEVSDKYKDQLFYNTSTYRDNPYINEDKIAEYRNYPPERRKVVLDGEWGTSEGLVFENFEIVDALNQTDIIVNKCAEQFVGLDFGYSNDPTALVMGALDKRNGIIYIMLEDGKTGMTNRHIANMIKSHGFYDNPIFCDSAEPKSIDELKWEHGLNVFGAKKGRNSIEYGIQLINQYKIIVDSRCTNVIEELNNYVFSENAGQRINKPIDKYNHWLDALRYAVTETNRRI